MSYAAYPDGSILQLSFHNFLTYEDTVCKPGENLNLILGHNGSGKSSIICGICLVFGGNPKTLGRSEKLQDYIRHGCEEAFVEVIIADKQKGPQSIKLTLKKGKSPEYRLNGNVTTQMSIRNLSKSYNIQIDNPCAFLAQDKVKSFSEQSPVDLLVNTEKAASAELHEEHMSLIEQRKDGSQIEDKCTSAIKAVQQIEDIVKNLEPRVENYRKKKQMQTRLRLLEQKLTILKFQEIDEEYQKDVKECDEIKEKYEKVKNEIGKLEANLKKTSSKMDKEREIVRNNKKQCDEILSNLDRRMDKDYVANRIKNAQREYDRQKDAHDKNEQKKASIITKLKDLERKLDDAEVEVKGYSKFVERFKMEESKLTEETKLIDNEEEAIRKKSYSMRTLLDKQRLREKEITDNLSTRLRRMEQLSRDSASAWTYYSKNRSKFKDDIYVPIMHMTLRTPDAAKYIENSIGSRDYCMFVCSNKDDELMINDSSKGWRINSTVVRKENVNHDQINATVTDELKKFGFRCFVSESFTAPDTLKQYLCNVFQLHRIPCGDSEVEKNLGSVADQMANTRYNVFITANIRVQISVSRYSNEVMQSQSQLRRPQVWTDSSFSKSVENSPNNSDDFARKLDEMREEVNAESEAIRIKKTEIQKKRDVLVSEGNDWREKRRMVMVAKSKLDEEKGALSRLERDAVDLENAERVFEKAKEDAEKGARTMFEDCEKMQKRYIDMYSEIVRCHLIEMQLRTKYNNDEAKKSGLCDERENCADEKRAAESHLQMVYNRRKTCSDILKEKCQLTHLTTSKMDVVQRKIYGKLVELFKQENLPDDEDSVEKQVRAEKTRLKVAEDSAEDGNAEDEKRMENLKLELIEEIAKRDKLLETKDSIQEKLGELIEKWKEKIEVMIEQINEKYRASFDKMGCLGEVHLEVPENKLEIANYGIMIMVCFRSGEKLKRLDQKVQSGGERSVSTMLYLLALQQLCPVPFRCVDEINQGMDPTNERKVFEIMVDLWSGDGAISKTQYFLLTPKLLHGLAMNDRVTVQIVHSVVPDNFKNWDTQRYLDATRAKCAV